MYEDMLRLIHVVGATVLFGTGMGIAFFMVMAHRTRDPAKISHVAGIVVLADALFTTTAVILQPLSGYLLARSVGWPLDTPWIVLSLGPVCDDRYFLASGRLDTDSIAKPRNGGRRGGE